MKTYKSIYEDIISISNLIKAWRKARKRKTKKHYVLEFEKNTIKNILYLYEELKLETYSPKKLKNFIIRDPKTRKVSKSEFVDRIVHHALVNILEPIYERIFIYDSCAGRKGKGTLFATNRFYQFLRKVSNYRIIENKFNDNNYIQGFCLKADIKHYFQEINHELFLNIIKRKIKDEKVIYLIRKILNNTNFERQRERERELITKGRPLGNLTSQFFANVYLNELDYFVKYELKAKYYIRYVDDFVILHPSKIQLEEWKEKINNFLKEKLKLELHKDKSKIIPLSKGIDFVGFRNFAYFRLLRKRNIRKINNKINLFALNKKDFSSIINSFQGWQGYAKCANTYKLRKNIKIKIIDTVWEKIKFY